MKIEREDYFIQAAVNILNLFMNKIFVYLLLNVFVTILLLVHIFKSILSSETHFLCWEKIVCIYYIYMCVYSWHNFLVHQNISMHMKNIILLDLYYLLLRNIYNVASLEITITSIYLNGSFRKI